MKVTKQQGLPRETARDAQTPAMPEAQELVQLFERAAKGPILLWAERLFVLLKAVEYQEMGEGIQRAISERRDPGACTVFEVAFHRARRRAATVRPDIRAALVSVLREVVDELDETKRREAEYERRSKAAAKGWETRRRRAGAG